MAAVYNTVTLRCITICENLLPTQAVMQQQWYNPPHEQYCTHHIRDKSICYHILMVPHLYLTFLVLVV